MAEALRLGKRVRLLLGRAARDCHVVLLLAMCAAYAVAMSAVSIDNHDRFYNGAFDAGIYDQAVWLLSRGRAPFATVEGMNVFGDHAQFILLLVAPLYRAWDSIGVLYVLQSVALAAGAIPLYFIAKDKFNNKWIPFAFVASYLLYPALLWTNLENFHPVSFAVPLLFSAFYFLTKKKYGLFLATVALLLITREELAFTTAALGAFAFFKYDRKVGAATVAASLAWGFVCMYSILPYFGGFGYFIKRPFAFAIHGTGVAEVLTNIAQNPGRLSAALFRGQNAEYLFKLSVPTAFLSLLSPETLFLAAPGLVINLLSGWWYMHSIEYHYTYAIIPFVFISAVYGAARLRDFMLSRNRKFGRLFAVPLAVVVLASLACNNTFGPYPTSVGNVSMLVSTIINFGKQDSRTALMDEAVGLVPPGASVSAAYLFVPHLTHREIVYMFPNPFRESYWGAMLGNYTPPTPTVDADYVLLDNTVAPQDMHMMNTLVDRQVYLKIFQREDVIVMKRNRSVAYDRGILGNNTDI
jgi:uncharacterized membrane protein